ILIGIEPDASSRIKLLDSEGHAIVEANVNTQPMPCRVVVEFESWSAAKYQQVDAEIEALYSEVGSYYRVLLAAKSQGDGDLDEDQADNNEPATTDASSEQEVDIDVEEGEDAAAEAAEAEEADDIAFLS